MILFDGNKEAQKIDEAISKLIREHLEWVRRHKLVIIQIGNNASSNKYVELKKRYGENMGVQVELHKLDENLSDLELNKKVYELIAQEEVGGCIIQLPLPRPSLNNLVELIPVEKDVDSLNSKNLEQESTAVLYRLSPVVKSVEYFISSMNELQSTKNAIVVGDGFLVGNPVRKYLEKVGFNVQTILDYKIGDKLNADLIVLAAGIPNLVKGEDISEGANVIDFGSSMVDGKIVGDLDINSNIVHLGLVSTSPGGMGPLVVRFLFWNFLENSKVN